MGIDEQTPRLEHLIGGPDLTANTLSVDAADDRPAGPDPVANKPTTFFFMVLLPKQDSYKRNTFLPHEKGISSLK
jgi:hypothetical protein